MAHGHDGCCSHKPATWSVHQTIDEMQFERGLWTASLDGDVSKVRSLLTQGKDPNEQDSGGYTALHYACRAGHKEVVESLLSHGADVNKPIRSSQATGLHRAAAMGHVDIAKLLISKGAKVCAADADNQTALHKAAQSNHPEMFPLLLAADASIIHVQDIRGRFAFDLVPSEKRDVPAYSAINPSNAGT